MTATKADEARARARSAFFDTLKSWEPDAQLLTLAREVEEEHSERDRREQIPRPRNRTRRPKP